MVPYRTALCLHRGMLLGPSRERIEYWPDSQICTTFLILPAAKADHQCRSLIRQKSPVAYREWCMVSWYATNMSPFVVPEQPPIVQVDSPIHRAANPRPCSAFRVPTTQTNVQLRNLMRQPRRCQISNTGDSPVSRSRVKTTQQHAVR